MFRKLQTQKNPYAIPKNSAYRENSYREPSDSSDDELKNCNYRNLTRIGRKRFVNTEIINVQNELSTKEPRTTLSVYSNTLPKPMRELPKPDFKEQLKEVELVKHKFSSRGTKFDLKQISHALMGPFESFKSKTINPCDLPKGGENLLSNSIALKSKSGKKKKKKKKK